MKGDTVLTVCYSMDVYKFKEYIKEKGIDNVLNKYIDIKSNKCDCPFCKKENNFFISNEKGKFKCYECNTEGDIVDFVSKYKNLTQEEACVDICNKIGIKLPGKSITEKEDLYKINMLAAKYYYEKLKNNKDAQKIYKERGLSVETMVKFGLGYNEDNKYEIEEYFKSKGISKTQLIKANILTRNRKNGNTFDKFRNRLMFPIFNENGNIVGFGGRKTREEQEPKYINTCDTPVFKKRENLFGLNMIKKDKLESMILCEGYMDVISLHQAGFTNAVAPLGTSFPEELSNKIKKYTDTVFLTFDSDEAGTKAKLRAITKLSNNNIKVFIPELKPYKDPDELIKKEGRNAFVEILKNSQDSFHFEVNNWLEEHKDKFANIFESAVTNASAKKAEKYFEAYKDITGKDFNYDELTNEIEDIDDIIQQIEETYEIIM